MSFVRTALLAASLAVFFLAASAKRKPTNKQLALQQKETSPVTFISLVIMRLVYGLATSMGLGERLADFMGGAFVPPGAEEDYEIVDFDY